MGVPLIQIILHSYYTINFLTYLVQVVQVLVEAVVAHQEVLALVRAHQVHLDHLVALVQVEVRAHQVHLVALVQGQAQAHLEVVQVLVRLADQAQAHLDQAQAHLAQVVQHKGD